MLSNEVVKVRDEKLMEYLLNLTYDPVVCSFYVSILLTIGLAYIWNHFIVKPYSYIATEASAEELINPQQRLIHRLKIQHLLIIWIMKCVRRKDSPNEDPDHHLSVDFSF
ncbi:hypothetical protein [Heyndrickxia vini]|uniref:ATP synthase F0 subunit 8 n=1 Tax=Heyndrickxia vini TaxID=1476025 RepID=A0ABX7E6U4_9BACI|nr:hypothetical protein [Heyndrickxia vini]QQZ11162.1 hypothetical protein I5776_09845 [Heyndrickxia vini]